MSKNLTASLSLRIRTFGTESVKGLKESLTGVGKAAENTKRAWDELGKAMQGSAAMNQAQEMFGKISGGVQKALQSPIEKFAEFELALGRARGKMDQISDQQFETMKKKAMELGQTTAYSSAQVAAAMGEMAASGFTVEQQLSAIDGVVGLATAGEVDLARATAIASTTLSQFGMHAEDTAMVSGVLVAASNASKIGLEEIAASLTYVGPIAKGANISLQSTASFIGLLGNAGIEASMAGTTLNAMIARLATQSPKARKQLAHLGISGKQMAKGVSDPVSALMLLNQQFDKKHYTAAQRMAAVMEIFGQESAKGVVALMAKGGELENGKTGFERMQTAVTNSSNAIANYNKNIENTAAVKMQKFTAQVDALQISLGEKLAPAAMELMRVVTPALTAFGDWIEGHPQTVVMLGEMAVGVGALAAAFGTLATVMGGASVISAGLKVLGAAGGISGAAGAATAAGTAASAAGAAGTAATVASSGGAVGSLGGTAAAGTAATAATGMATAVGAASVAAIATTVVGGLVVGGLIGTLADRWIGESMGVRGGKLSTEGALRMGEDSNGMMNNTMAVLGKIPGLGSLAEVAEGNRRRNAEEQSAKTNGHADDVTSSMSKFNAVTGKIEVMITDQRPKVRTEAQGPLALRVGTSSAGRQ